MPSGRLDRRVVLQSRAAGVDAIGQPVISWADVATVWGDLRFTSGLETTRGDAPVSSAKASLRIRGRSGLNAGMRAVVDGVAYEIEAVLPQDRAGPRGWIDLVCVRVGG